MDGFLGVIGAAVVALVGRLSISSRPDRARKAYERTLELYKASKDDPALASAATTLAALLDAQADHVSQLESKAHGRVYDGTTLVVAVAFASIFGYGAWWLWESNDWYWRVLAVPVGGMAVLLVWFGIDTFIKGPAMPKKGSATG